MDINRFSNKELFFNKMQKLNIEKYQRPFPFGIYDFSFDFSVDYDITSLLHSSKIIRSLQAFINIGLDNEHNIKVRCKLFGIAYNPSYELSLSFPCSIEETSFINWLFANIHTILNKEAIQIWQLLFQDIHIKSGRKRTIQKKDYKIHWLITDYHKEHILLRKSGYLKTYFDKEDLLFVAKILKGFSLNSPPYQTLLELFHKQNHNIFVIEKNDIIKDEKEYLRDEEFEKELDRLESLDNENIVIWINNLRNI
jgi:hypothetical protein